MRQQFLLDPGLAQFAAFVLSPHTKVLDAAIKGYRDELATDTEKALVAGIEREAAVRDAAAAYHGGTAGQYALTDSTTMGLGLMYGGLQLGAGAEVLTTTHDFYSTEDSLRLLRKRTGASIKQVTLYDEPAQATVDQMVGRVAAAITPRTKVVALTWVHSSTGVRVPVAEVCAALAALSKVPRDQYVVCVDGVHGFSAVDVDLPDLGCDFLSAGTHKWLFGPRGTGILWGREWGPLTEVIPTFSDPSDPAGRMTPGGYHSFEHRWAAADAFGFMSSIGRDRLVARTVGAGHPAQGGPRWRLRPGAEDAVVPGPLGRHRLLRGARSAAAGRRPQAPRGRRGGQLDAVRHVVRPARTEHRDQPGPGRRRGRGDRLDALMTRRWTATELLDLVLDEGSYVSWDDPVDVSGHPEDYRRQLEAAARKAGTDESVVTGRGLVRGRPVAVVVNEFRFLAGSIGVAAAHRIAGAVRRATAEGLPVLAATASGGTRMQEGTPAFVGMVEISRALMVHRAEGLPYLVYLRHPTTGGVFASWGSLGHVTAAEPGALVGFLGPKVYEALNDRPFPPGVQTAENLAEHGVIDAVVAPGELPALVDLALGVLVDPPVAPVLPRREGDPDRHRSAWTSVEATRADGPGRHPGAGPPRHPRDPAPAWHRRGGARRLRGRRAHPDRRPALRAGRAGPHPADPGDADGSGRPA